MVSPEKNRSFDVNPEFQDNPENWHACFKENHYLIILWKCIVRNFTRIILNLEIKTDFQFN